ncbi:MAG: hypothetical protein DI586_05440 [Micavibrio aeruginosavorus]|uniref:Uncharacterized protein n=1 Tax=Micavibrio aeruginosavorus TaxID=349221 RepID=A0A2W5FIT2_9BACT|nr:MAG: hypothetical protein DI586_05440 [Micavibrio aeruginosavorus]
MSKDLLRQLHCARTYGDVYSVPLPLTVRALQNLDVFSSLQQSAFWTPSYGQKPPAEMLEAAAATLAFDRQIELPSPQEWNFRAHRHFNEMVLERVDRMHPDYLFEPRKRVYLASDEAGTMIVSHEDTLDIISRDPDSRHILDLEMDEKHNSCILMHIERLAPQFSEAAKPAPLHSVTMMCGATLHKRPGHASRERVFFHASAFTAD